MVNEKPLTYDYQATKSFLLANYKKPTGAQLINDLQNTIKLAQKTQTFSETRYNKRYNLCISYNNSVNFFKLDAQDGIILSIENCYYDLLCQNIKPVSFSTKVNDYINDQNKADNYYQISGYKKAIDFIKTQFKLSSVSPQDKMLSQNTNWVSSCIGVKDSLNPFKNAEYASEDEYIVLFGTTEPEFDGSIWAQTKKNIELGGLPPAVRQNQITKFASLIKAVLLYHKSVSTYSIGPGGLITGLYKICQKSNLGIKLDLEKLSNNMTAFDILLSESSNRFLACMNKDLLRDLDVIVRGSEITKQIIGKTTADNKNTIEIKDVGTLEIKQNKANQK
ncbi:MAG: hypothetical protein LBT91_01065 [Bifidobacteriaceae bacterium]|jgi:phosphoribosylformylglycinamidine (FGAM) synthase-like enzyme|nr:hypothetical protein [Bifidobacteriaceae bacterium]